MRGFPFSWSKVDFAVQSTTSWAFASVTRAASRRHGIVFICLRVQRPLCERVDHEDDKYDGEEDAVERRRRSLVARRALSFPGAATRMVRFTTKTAFWGVGPMQSCSLAKFAVLLSLASWQSQQGSAAIEPDAFIARAGYLSMCIRSWPHAAT